MAGKNISHIDKKGRLLIPQSLRDAMGMKEGEAVILTPDVKNRSMTVEPARERKLLRIEVALGDSPGNLARAATVLARLGVDLVSTQSHSARRGETAIWEVECSPGKVRIGRISPALRKAGARVTSIRWD
ncbi:MAG: hypothetical protein M0Z36_04690 [Thermaerobacter sp.]|jgi:AbrB family looped-hinge helix DNA binding protein|nr:hypothetical protein [Candidatus Marsarchaeota archaeon]MDA8205344.1 hypothetical protein [Thermaerobacter sp.]